MNNPMAWLADRVADIVGAEGARVRAELAAGVTKTLDAARVSGALALPLAAGRMRTSRGRLVGWSIRETSGTGPATVTVTAGSDGSDPTKLLAVVQLAAGAGATLLPALPGVFFAEGVTVTVTGAAAGALYFATD